ncbi:MAG TPA: TetR/AcrR family transcriptional regulator [Thermoanaerobaculia bacterium]|nr:TetR/AcrR family transcriptional regulator [Thermoanaerobaculia bacterium]
MSIHSRMAHEKESAGSSASVENGPPEGKRERILKAAVEIFARNGYFNARVSEIAKAAGVADGTIYLYFEGKEDLLITIFREHTRSYLQSLQQSLLSATGPVDQMRTAIRHHLAALGRNRSLAVVSQIELRHSLKFLSLFSHTEVADYLEMLRTIIEEGQSAGVFRRTLHPQFVAKSVFGILDEMVTSWILSEKEYDLAREADDVALLVLDGLSVERAT